MILATNLVATTADAPSFAATILAMATTIGLPKTVLADTGFASGPAVADLQARGITPLVAIGQTQPHRPYDFRPPPKPKMPRRIIEPWRIAMKAKLETDDARALYAKRKQTVEPVFGIIKSVLGFVRFRLRGLQNVASEWTLIALAYNCSRITRLRVADRPPNPPSPKLGRAQSDRLLGLRLASKGRKCDEHRRQSGEIRFPFPSATCGLGGADIVCDYRQLGGRVRSLAGNLRDRCVWAWATVSAS